MSTQVHSVDIDLDGRQWTRIASVSRHERLTALYRRSQHRPISRAEFDYVNRELNGWSPDLGGGQEEIIDDTDDNDDEDNNDFRVRTTRSPRNEELEGQTTREAENDALSEDDRVEYQFESDEDDDSERFDLSEDSDGSETDSDVSVEESNEDSEDIGMPLTLMYLC